MHQLHHLAVQKKNENNAFAAAFGDEQVPDLRSFLCKDPNCWWFRRLHLRYSAIRSSTWISRKSWTKCRSSSSCSSMRSTKKKHLITKQRRTWSGTSGINGAGVPPFVKGKSLFHTCWNHLNLGQSHSACQLEPLKHGIPHYSSLAHQAFDSVGRLHNKYHQVRFSG